jgi:predicted RNase H-like HicB family nuclease
MLIEWDPEDRIFVVTVPEFPGCQTHGHTYEEAVREGQEAIETWVAGALEDGQQLPQVKPFMVNLE